MAGIKEQDWYRDPFGWYVRQDKPEMLGVKLTNNVALDILQGLYDIYKTLKSQNKEKALEELNTLAVLVIASCTGYGSEAIEELLVDEFNDKDIDGELAKMIEGESNG